MFFFPETKSVVLKDISNFGDQGFWILTIYYTLIGIVMGMFVKAILNIFVSSGAIITQEVGFGAVRYFDPNAGQAVGPFEKLIYWTMLIMIISSGALLPMFKGVLLSFEKLSFVNTIQIDSIVQFFIHMFKNIFSASLLLASPLIFTNVFITTVLGIIARTVPQMNVLMVSFVVNIGLGLLVFLATSTEFFQVGHKLYTESLGEWFVYFTK